MRTYDEVATDILTHQIEYERFINNPDSFSQNEYGEPVDLMAKTDALGAELEEIVGPEASFEEYTRILYLGMNGLFPEPEQSN